MRQLIYIGNTRLPTEKAHGLEDMKLCEAFVRQGLEVEFIAPFRFNAIRQNPFEYYRVERIFTIKKVPSIDLLPLLPGRAGFWIQRTSFALFVLLYLLWKRKPFNREIVYFSNEYASLFLVSFFTNNVYYDVHRLLSSSWFYKLYLPRLRGISVTNRWMHKELMERFGLEPRKIAYIPNGTDIKEFDIPLSRESCRQKLDLPLDPAKSPGGDSGAGKKIVLYTGHLYSWKGVDTLAQASQYLPEDVRIYFVGGTEWDIKRFKFQVASLGNIEVVGHKPHAEIPIWLKAADVLVLPNTAREDISKYYTAPLKMFEYMAAKRPIVASDLPSMRDILNEDNAVLVEPDNPEALAGGIKRVLQDNALAERISARAWQDVQQYTWENRAKKILELISRTKNKGY